MSDDGTDQANQVASVVAATAAASSRSSDDDTVRVVSVVFTIAGGWADARRTPSRSAAMAAPSTGNSTGA